MAAALSDRERLAWLRLCRSENVGPITFRYLLRRFGSAEAALEALPELARRGGRERPLRIYPAAAAEREMVELRRLGGSLITDADPIYPALLREVDDAPPLLSVLGNPALLEHRAVAVVGARNASANGRLLAETIARELGALGWIVVSGLARGIDAAAHRGALESGTIAVLAGGLDQPYPPESEPLYREIARRGVLLAEMPLGRVPQARHFPRRNRIVAGLALGTVVIEAAVKSGSLITARLAGEQGREVMAVPGSPLDPRCRGANQLIRQGATLVENAADVAELLGGLAGSLGSRLSIKSNGVSEPVADLDECRPDPGIPTDSARSEVERRLGPSPVPVDELLRQCQLSPPFLRMTLLELELAGRLQWHPGNRVSLLAVGVQSPD
ncbi:MAG: processing protein [Rhodospirillaceae bacterium]|jgi:DNA processing protein|nr:processing protein [Rhodospirillaceae bacterium]